MTITYWIFAVIIFLSIGSFLNVVIYRYPKILLKQWREEAEDFLCEDSYQQQEQAGSSFNLAFPNSHCTHCQHELSWWHNIPLLSYLFLAGHCYFCKKNISWQYPFIECLTALLASAILYRFGFSYAAIIPILATFLLITMSAIDFKTQLLPDNLTYIFLWLGLLQNTIFHIIPLSSAIYGAIFGYAVLWIIGTGYRLIRKQDGMGYGDYKLLAAIGAWFGPYLVIITLLIASVASLIISVTLLATNKIDSKRPLAFGPYLAIAAYLILWIGPVNLMGLIF